MALQEGRCIWNIKTVLSSVLVAIFYFVFSVVGFSSLYFLSRRFSGERFRWKWFCAIFVLTVFLGSFHMSTVEYGYDVLFPVLKPVLKNNQAVEWIAFVSIFLHICCIPTQQKPKRWFEKGNR